MTTHAHRLPRSTAFFGWSVALAFLALNVSVAYQRLQIQGNVRGQAVSALEGVKQLATQRSALLSARPNDGLIELGMMRQAGVKVPDSFAQGDHFVSPWGYSSIVKQGGSLVWDFYEIPVTGCTQLLEASGNIAGVVKVATSGQFKDELAPPVTRERAADECRRTPLIARLVLK